MINPQYIVESTLVPHSAFIEAGARIERCMHNTINSPESACVAIVGESRTGKSTVLDEFCRNHPKYREEDGLYTPVLKVVTPSNPTVKGLAELMLEKMGDPRYESGTEIAKTNRLKVLMRNSKTNMVVIDEFQHFCSRRNGVVAHHVADWLKTLVDENRCGLVVAGLPSGLAVLEQNEQLSGRFFTPMLMPRFDWRVEEHREEFLGILGAFQESIGRYFDIPKLDEEDMGFRIFRATGGLIGYLSKFLKYAVWGAIEGGQKVITLEGLRKAYQESIWDPNSLPDAVNPFDKNYQPRHIEGQIGIALNIGCAKLPNILPRRKIPLDPDSRLVSGQF